MRVCGQQDYRDLLGALRDRNETMSPSDFWRQLPVSVRGRISRLGKCLGTGSVKQVHLALGSFNSAYKVCVCVCLCVCVRVCMCVRLFCVCLCSMCSFCVCGGGRAGGR